MEIVEYKKDERLQSMGDNDEQYLFIVIGKDKIKHPLCVCVSGSFIRQKGDNFDFENLFISKLKEINEIDFDQKQETDDYTFNPGEKDYLNDNENVQRYNILCPKIIFKAASV